MCVNLTRDNLEDMRDAGCLTPPSFVGIKERRKRKTRVIFCGFPCLKPQYINTIHLIIITKRRQPASDFLSQNWFERVGWYTCSYGKRINQSWEMREMRALHLFLTITSSVTQDEQERQGDIFVSHRIHIETWNKEGWSVRKRPNLFQQLIKSKERTLLLPSRVVVTLFPRDKLLAVMRKVNLRQETFFKRLSRSPLS